MGGSGGRGATGKQAWHDLPLQVMLILPLQSSFFYVSLILTALHKSESTSCMLEACSSMTKKSSRLPHPTMHPQERGRVPLLLVWWKLETHFQPLQVSWPEHCGCPIPAAAELVPFGKFSPAETSRAALGVTAGTACSWPGFVCLPQTPESGKGLLKIKELHAQGATGRP